MSARNVDSLDRRLVEILNDLLSRVRRLERRRPTGTGGGDCDCEDGAPGAPGAPGADGADGEGVPTGGSTGQLLAKNSNTSFDTGWIDAPTGGGDCSTCNLDDLADVDTTGAVNGNVLTYSTGTWAPDTPPAPDLSIDDLNDVNTSFVEPDDLDVLTWIDADSQWEPRPGPADGTDGQWGGAITIPYHFSTTTTNSDPGSGNLRLDQATQDTADTIRADVLDANGASWENLLDTMGDVTSAVKGHIRMVRATAPTEWFLFEITAVGSESGYRNITVVLSEIGTQGGSSPFVNGELIYLLYSRTGDAGADGTDGTTATSIIASAELASSQGSITTETDITGVTVTFTAVAGRQYKISARGTVLSSVAGDVATVRITTGGNTALGDCDVYIHSPGTGASFSTYTIETPGAGSVTYKVRIVRSLGTGNITAYESASAPFMILVEDLTGGATTGAITTASPLGAPGTPNLVRSYKGVIFVDTGNYWWPHGGAMEQIQWEWTHFFNNNAQKAELQSSVNGTGAAANAGVAAAGAQGVLSLDTGTTSTGRASYAAGQSSALRGTADKLMHFHTRVRFPTLSTSGERYYFQVGYISSLTAAAGDGFYFRYDESVSANWYAVVVNNGTGTAGTDTTIAVATNSFQKLRIEIDEPNVSAKFYIDDTLRATITTNFPGTTRDFGPGINLRKSVGSTARTCDVDYLGYWSLMTTTV